MGAKQSLSKGFIDEFASLDGPSKVDALIDLVKLCPYQQEIEFLERFHCLIYKDFLSSLPPRLTGKLLSYLSISDVLACSLVSREWNQVVTDCASYWQTFSVSLSLGEGLIAGKAREYENLKQLCVAAYKQKRLVRSLGPAASFLVSRSTSENSCLYAGNGVSVRMRCRGKTSGQLQAEEVVVERTDARPDSSMLLASFSMPTCAFLDSKIKWLGASEHYLLWKQADGRWSGCSTVFPDPDLDQWNDEPLTGGYPSINFCHKCNLVVLISEGEDDCEVWDLQVVKLMRGHSHPKKMVYPIHLEGIQAMGALQRHFLGGRVVVCPNYSERRDSSGFCEIHRLFIQVGNCILLHRLEATYCDSEEMVASQLLPDATLSRPLKTLVPVVSPALGGGGGGGGSNETSMLKHPGQSEFCFAADFSCVGVVFNQCLHVWSLEEEEEEGSASGMGHSVVDLSRESFPDDIRCIAVGCIHTVLASNSHGTCVVVSTQTGEQLVEGQFCSIGPEKFPSPRFSFWPPIHQEWLSSFDVCYGSSWPIAVMLDYYPDHQTENISKDMELKLVIGNPSAHS